MPLTSGSSREVISHNIKELRGNNYDERQSIAIALKRAGKSYQDAEVVRAAGIMFVAGDKALFLQRSLVGDHAGDWCFPGGKIEGDETALSAARRECVEEMGFMPDVEATEHVRRISTEEMNPNPEAPVDGVDFTTFIARVPHEFTPRLNGEHVGFCWAPVTMPPQPLHPGCWVALKRLTMTETDVAKAMVAGELSSPQKFMNLTLFLMRITGTGTAYRTRLDEHVYRRPENYLTPDFLERCNGLPVIVDHPDGPMLDTIEYRDRNVGTIVFPFIWDDEVWGVAKIWDQAAAGMMVAGQFSTSPDVVFRSTSDNSTLQVEGGPNVLIEGIPALLDHLAICEVGVWDKGRGPSGIIVNRGDSDMPMTEAERAAKDAEIDKRLTGIDSSVKECMDSVKAAMDSVKGFMDAQSKRDADEKERADKAKADAEEVEKADKAKRDAEEKEKADAEEKEKADAAKRDAEKEEAEKKDSAAKALAAENVALKARLDEMDKRIPIAMSDDDHAKVATAQARADAVYMAHSKKAPARMSGETFAAYRRRLLQPMTEFCPAWKDKDLAKLDDGVLEIAETQVYADADRAARDPKTVEVGKLRQVTRKDDAGRSIHTFYGDMNAWMAPHSTVRRAAQFVPMNSNGAALH